MTTIYLDVLILLNIFVSFFLFQATARLMNLRLGKWRLLAGSLLGGVYSLLILFELNSLELALVKVAMGVSLVLMVFLHPRTAGGAGLFCKTGLCFFLVNFIFAGFMQALWMFAAPAGMAYRNGVAYFNISALTLAASTIAAYLVITLFTHILNKRNRKTELVQVTVSLRGRQVALTAFVDTGNKLCDIFTGLPVVVCEFEAIKEIFPERVRDFFRDPSGFSFERVEDSELATLLKVIPVNAVSGASALPAFKPDDLTADGVSRQVMIAVTVHPLSDGSFHALLNPVL